MSGRRFCARLAGTAAAALLLAASLPATDLRQSLQRTRSLAESQHEIVLLLIQKREFAKAAAEASKIFQMKWPEDQEPTLLRELLFFADKFLHAGVPVYGVQIIDASFKNFRAPKSQIAIWKEKGYLHKNMNESDKAIECFREAQRIEASLR